MKCVGSSVYQEADITNTLREKMHSPPPLTQHKAESVHEIQQNKIYIYIYICILFLKF